MKRTIWFCLPLIFLAACGANQTASPNSSATQTANVAAQNQPKAADAVQVSIDKTEIKIGGTGEAIVKLKIQPPFHVNANPPSEANLIATAVEFESKNDLTFGKPIYPAGVMKKFSFSEKPLAVYEDEIEIRLPLKAAASAAKSEQKLNGKLRFQPCDDEVCYRPQTVAVALPVEVF